MAESRSNPTELYTRHWPLTPDPSYPSPSLNHFLWALLRSRTWDPKSPKIHYKKFLTLKLMYRKTFRIIIHSYFMPHSNWGDYSCSSGFQLLPHHSLTWGSFKLSPCPGQAPGKWNYNSGDETRPWTIFFKLPEDFSMLQKLQEPLS